MALIFFDEAHALLTPATPDQTTGQESLESSSPTFLFKHLCYHVLRRCLKPNGFYGIFQSTTTKLHAFTPKDDASGRKEWLGILIPPSTCSTLLTSLPFLRSFFQGLPLVSTTQDCLHPIADLWCLDNLSRAECLT